jgi:hypothetical protein
MQHPRLWLLPQPQLIICAQLSRLPGEREEDQVDYDGQSYAQYHSPRARIGTLFPSPLEVLRTVGHKQGRAFISNTTSSETASR